MYVCILLINEEEDFKAKLQSLIESLPRQDALVFAGQDDHTIGTGQSHGTRDFSFSQSVDDDSLELDSGTVYAEPLSPREIDIIRCIAQGYTRSEIAEKLWISKKTVDTHRANVRTKLGLHTRWELTSYARKHFGAGGPNR